MCLFIVMPVCIYLVWNETVKINEPYETPQTLRRGVLWGQEVDLESQAAEQTRGELNMRDGLPLRRL